MKKVIVTELVKVLLSISLVFVFIETLQHFGVIQLHCPPCQQAQSALSKITCPQDGPEKCALDAHDFKIMGWRLQKSDSISFNPGDADVLGPILAEAGSEARVKIEIKALLPLTMAFVAGDKTADGVRLANYAHAPSPATCMRVNVLEGDMDCTLPADGVKRYFVAQDARQSKMPELLAAGVAAFMGIKNPAENLLTPNPVHLNFYHWRCVEHCEKK